MKTNIFVALLLAFFLIYCTSCTKEENIISVDPEGQGPIPGGSFYVATWGSDDSSGTFENPWATWQKAFETARAGDTVYFRGGVWYPAEHRIGNSVTMIDLEGYGTGSPIGHSGTYDNPICFFNYPGEYPVLDCWGVDMTGNTFNDGLRLAHTHHLKFRGLTIRNLIQPLSGGLPMGITTEYCSNLSFENMVLHDIQGRGFYYISAVGYEGITYDTLRVINCDIFNCADMLSAVPGNHADAFKYGGEPGAYALFQGCRAWNCSDDGYDLGGSSIVIIDNCWSFNHGMVGALDGNGFKFGAITDELVESPRIVKNCLAAFNYGSGFFDLEYDGYYRTNARIYNNTSYKNGRNNEGAGFQGTSAFNSPEKPYMLSKYRNNISYQNNIIADLGTYTWYEEHHNTWDAYPNNQSPFNINTDTVTVTDADFVSLDGTELNRPRKEDGSLPDITFMKLAPGSDLIDAGTIDVAGSYIDYPDSLSYIYDPLNANPDHIYPEYFGNAPDFGAFESE